MNNTILVLGEGAWGTALAQVLARNGNDVALWCQDTKVYTDIQETGENKRYMPGVIIDRRIIPVIDLKNITQANIIVITTPLRYLRQIITKAASYFTSDKIVVFACKGIEQDTLLTPHQVVEDVLGYTISHAVLAGPSFAKNVILDEPTAVMIAGEKKFINIIMPLFDQPHFKLVETSDVSGTIYSGVYKNVVAIGMGILEGAKYHENTKAWLLTCAVHEMEKLLSYIGAHPSTLLSLAGIGDLVLTSYSTQSKNVRFGVAIAQGKTIAQLQKELVLPEGVNSLQALHEWQKQHTPLILMQTIFDICFNGASTQLLLKQLSQFRFHGA